MIPICRAYRFFRTAALLALGVLFLLPGQAQAQTGEDALRFTNRFPATGARMMGLAGAGIAGIADYTALQYNPAALGYFEKSTVAGSFNTLLTLDESTFLLPQDLTRSRESDLRSTGLGNLAYIGKAPTTRGALVFGVGYLQAGSFDRSLLFRGPNAENSITDSFLPYDDEFQVIEEDSAFFPEFFEGADVPEVAYRGGAIEFLAENVGTGGPLFYQAVDPATTIVQQGDVLEEGGMRELSFGGAVEAVQGVMFGASVNYAFGTYRFRSLFEEIDEQDQNQEDQYVVILPDGELRGFDRLEYIERFESDLDGFNVRAGMSADVASGLRLGLRLESPTFYQVDENYDRRVTTIFDVGGSLSYGGGPNDVGSGAFEYEITTPWRFGAGLAFVRDDFLISADAEFVDWTQMKLDASTDEFYFDEVNAGIRENLRAVVNTNIGAEYRLGNIALRAGFARQPDARDESLTEDLDLDRTKTFFSAGVGYRFAEQVQVDFGWMQERFDDRYVPYANLDPGMTPPSVAENVVRNRFAVGLQVLF